VATNPSSLEGWVKKYNWYISAASKRLAESSRLLAAERKKKAPNPERIKFYVERTQSLSKEIAKWKTGVADTRNKIYVREGQYENLLKGSNRDAYMAISALFKTYGLDTLAPKIFDYVKNGYSADTISILLQDTPEYKQRFAGNELRTKAGLPVLSAGEYLATEASYRQIMQAAGMPIGYYDQPGDFNQWIAKNVSPSEIQDRVDLASQATALAPASYREALKQMGISGPELTAYFLNPTKALPFLQKTAATAAVGAEAIQQGLTFDQSYSEQLALRGVTTAQAQQGYQQVAGELGSMTDLGKIYGTEWGQRQSEEAVFGTNAETVNTKAGLLAREKGSFSGASGAARGGLAQSGGAK
jgi:hypothetical protein